MIEESKRTRVVVTVTGADVVGVAAALTEVVADNGATLIDIEQVVVQGQLTLCLLIDVDSAIARGEPVLKDLLFRAKSLGMDLRFDVVEAEAPKSPCGPEATRYAVTAIGDGLDARGVHVLTHALAQHGANIEAIRRLSRSSLTSLEITACLAGGPGQVHELRAALVKVAMEHDFDVAVQRERVIRRSKRLIVFDMDSTLIQMECIDELARMHGVVDRVAGITARAMAGELDFEASLRERVGLLRGLDASEAFGLAENLPITEGAREMLAVLRKLGYRTGVISGGFTFAADRLKTELELDYAFANELEVRDGKLTGGLVGAIVGPARKAELLHQIAEREKIAVEQTIAVGDGANDLPMLEAAGLGIAFHPKPKLREAADTSVSRGGLDRILYLLGLTSQDVADLLGRPA
jgi:phosphoserine phosphatase